MYVCVYIYVYSMMHVCNMYICVYTPLHYIFFINCNEISRLTDVSDRHMIIEHRSMKNLYKESC